MAQGHRAGRRQRAEESDDDQLCERVRRGDEAAFAELYRRHRKAAEATARCFVRSRTDADDVVSDAFAGVLSAMRNGFGPRDNFRRYLLACVRNGCRVRPRNVPVAPEDHRLDARRPDDGPLLEDPERYVEADTVARAFSALSPRWQQMLWSTAVEQKSPQELGEQLSMSPNAAAALAHRAREAFATAYLGEHLGSGSSPECSRYVPHLAGHVRDQLPPGRADAVRDHVESCLTCSAAVADLRDVNASLRTLIPAPGALVPTALPLAVPPGASTGITGAATAGVSLTGLAVKALVGALLVAPFLIVRATGFDGGIADGLRRPVLPVDSVIGGTPTTVVGPPAPAEPVADGSSAPVVDVRPAEGPDSAPPGSRPIDVAGQVDSPVTGSPSAGSGSGGAVGGPIAVDEAPTSPSLPATTAEGLLGTLGVDDALEPVRLDIVPDTVDAIVYALTAEVVAPVLATAVQSLGLPVDLAALPAVPGVVVVPPTTVANDPLVVIPTVAAPAPAPTAPPTAPAPAPAPTVPATSPTPPTPAPTSPPGTSPPATSPPTTQGVVCSVLDLLGLCATG